MGWDEASVPRSGYGDEVPCPRLGLWGLGSVGGGDFCVQSGSM